MSRKWKSQDNLKPRGDGTQTDDTIMTQLGA